MQKSDWVWMPHPGHFICSRDCRFHLNTCVGDFIVSTVGEYFPEEGVREILANSRGIVLEGRGDARRADYMKKIGYEDLGINGKYETMVFVSEKSEAPCCPFTARSYQDLTCSRYNDPGEAFKGHLELCQEFSTKIAPPESKGDV